MHIPPPVFLILARTHLNKKPKPITSGCGGRKFFLPRIMKLPVTRYSPEGAVLDT